MNCKLDNESDMILSSEKRINTPVRRQSKTLILSTNVDQKSLETELSIAICRMAIENTVSSDFDPRSSIVKSVFDCHLPGVINALSWYMYIARPVSVHYNQ